MVYRSQHQKKGTRPTRDLKKDSLIGSSITSISENSNENTTNKEFSFREDAYEQAGRHQDGILITLGGRTPGSDGPQVHQRKESLDPYKDNDA